MDEQKKNPKSQVTKIIGVPRAANIAAAFAAIIIIFGIAESAYFLKLSLFEITIISGILFLFYIILLSAILRPRVLRVLKKMPQKTPPKVPTPEIKTAPVTVNINNQSPVKRKSRKKRK